MTRTHELAGLAGRLRAIARARNHRLSLLLAGEPDWATAAARDCLERDAGQGAWLSDRHLDFEHRRLAAGLELLGGELDYLVYDALGGFDPDSFGAAVGALCGGGLLFLLTPPLERWAGLVDPQAERIAVEPFGAARVSNRFIDRLARVLGRAPAVTVVHQHKPAPALPPKVQATLQTASRTEGMDCRTSDQRDAVEAILRTARGRARRPLVITSDRGRGKSSALGIAAAGLLRDRPQARILVTAPRRAAVEPLFRHAARLLPGARVRSGGIDHEGGGLLFLPPDALIAGSEIADLLLVDEAAGIPAPLLETLLGAHPRVVFATTIHGYEGTGRGFEVRFRRSLERLTPNHRRIELHSPIRWAPGDPLEALVSRALLLDASPASEHELERAELGSCTHELLDRDHLAGDETTLSELFGLLVLAHYQTRPLDLRHLLDGPNIRVHILRRGKRVVATALVAREGGFGPELARQVFDGERRPRGHLLPQTLAAHAGLEESPLLHCDRIIRIAVHPAANGRGLGRMLLQTIVQRARADGLDMVGASFGATRGLLRFWDRCGFSPVHLGTSRNAASGAQAAVVLCPLTAAGEDLRKRACERLGRHFPGLLAGPFRDLESGIAAAMLAAVGADTSSIALLPEDRRELLSFACAQRPLEATLGPIHTLLRTHLAAALRAGHLDEREVSALIGTVLQYKRLSGVAVLIGATGRAQVVAILRQAVRRLIPGVECSDG